METTTISVIMMTEVMFMFIVTAIEDNDDRAFMLNLYNNYYRLVRKTIYGLTQNNKDIEDLINGIIPSPFCLCRKCKYGQTHVPSFLIYPVDERGP